MFEQPRVIMTIDPKGNFTLEVVGAKGTVCKDLTAALEKAMGVPLSQSNKPEYYVKPITEKVTNKF